MPDDRSPSSGPLASWGEAFAVLPLETPDAGAWQRIERARPRPRRARWPAWTAAIAAALAVIALMPTLLSKPPRTVDPREVVQSHGAAASVVRDASADAAGGETTTRLAPAEPRLAIAPASTSGATGRARRADAGSRVSHVSSPAIGTEETVASAQDSVDASTNEPAVNAGDPTQTPATDELERLYAESAQLETLLNLARDERVSSGTAAALASDFDAQVAGIDAELVQPGITRDRRTQLWRERIDALRQLTAFESTQRLLAAQGERYDARLVSID
jgi:hypothetical protein